MEKEYKGRIVMAVSNDLLTDQRVDRHRRALTEAGYDVVVLGRREVPTRHGRGWQFYYELNRGLARRIAPLRPAVVWANDTDTLPGCWRASRRCGARLVLDCHELFPEVPEIQHKPVVKWVWRTIERRLMPQCDALLTVSGGIADYYRQRLGVEMAVVRNIPEVSSGQCSVSSEQCSVSSEQCSVSSEQCSVFSEQCSVDSTGSSATHYPLPTNHSITHCTLHTLLYQGRVNLGRGVDWAIDALEWLPDCRLVVAGDGDLLEEMKAYAAAKPWSDRIGFTGRLMPSELQALTRQADVGLVMLEDMGLSYHYALPNRIGDFVAAGVPMVVSDLPEMSAVVRRFGVGEVIDRLHGADGRAQARALARAVEKVLARGWTDADFDAARKDMDWNKEKQILIKTADRLCSTTSI